MYLSFAKKGVFAVYLLSVACRIHPGALVELTLKESALCAKQFHQVSSKISFQVHKTVVVHQSCYRDQRLCSSSIKHLVAVLRSLLYCALPIYWIGFPTLQPTINPSALHPLGADNKYQKHILYNNLKYCTKCLAYIAQNYDVFRASDGKAVDLRRYFMQFCPIFCAEDIISLKCIPRPLSPISPPPSRFHSDMCCIVLDFIMCNLSYCYVVFLLFGISESWFWQYQLKEHAGRECWECCPSNLPYIKLRYIQILQSTIRTDGKTICKISLFVSLSSTRIFFPLLVFASSKNLLLCVVLCGILMVVNSDMLLLFGYVGFFFLLLIVVWKTIFLFCGPKWKLFCMIVELVTLEVKHISMFIYLLFVKLGCAAVCESIMSYLTIRTM